MKKISYHLFLVVIVAVLALLQIIFANKLATSGEVLQKMEKEAEVLKMENRRLSNQIASCSSLLELEEKAKQLGFSKNPSVVYLPDQKGIALKF